MNTFHATDFPTKGKCYFSVLNPIIDDYIKHLAKLHEAKEPPEVFTSTVTHFKSPILGPLM